MFGMKTESDEEVCARQQFVVDQSTGPFLEALKCFVSQPEVGYKPTTVFLRRFTGLASLWNTLCFVASELEHQMYSFHCEFVNSPLSFPLVFGA